MAFSETLFRELAITGSSVGVSVLCPGFVKTRIADYDRFGQAATPSKQPSGIGQAVLARITDAVAAGSDPSDVADLVHDAVLARQFYVFTDDGFEAAMRSRQADINTTSNPT